MSGSSIIGGLFRSRDEEEDDPGEIEGMDTTFALLKNERRRYVVRELDETMLFRDLAERVAENQYGPNYSSDERKSVYVSLFQAHIPRLEEAGFVVKDNHVIAPTEEMAALRRVLAVAGREMA